METTIALPARVQDYILDTAKEKAPAVIYEVVLENNTDFVVSRRTLRAEKELVILISQGLYYLKDKKTNAIDSITESALKTFLRDIRVSLPMPRVHWLPVLVKTSAEYINRIIADEVFTDMCRHNVLCGITDPEWYRRFWVDNSKLFLQLHSIYPTIADEKKFQASFSVVYDICDKFGYNEAIHFAGQLVQSGIQEFSGERYGRYYDVNSPSFISLVTNSTYNLQLRRFVDFILFDLYTQGMAKVTGEFWREYQDYLEMQLKFYGRIDEKYPKYFKTMHDVVTLKYNNLKFIENCQNFEARSAEIADLAYVGREYCVVIPNHPQDLVNEGIALSHCVKDYIGRVADGECHILFLRKTATPDIPLVTMQLSGKFICQAQGLNRRSITADERRFLQRWSSENKLTFDA